MKRLIYILLMSIIMLLMLSINVYGFENDIYKIDVPSDYKESSYNGSSVFVKSDEMAIAIFAKEDIGLKKNLSTMSKSEINKLVDRISGYKTEVIDQGKEKLGKSKAIKLRVKTTDSDAYMDMYIVVSDKHILMVDFMAKSESDLDNIEFMQIKKSFVMKERTTNVTLIRLLEILLIGGSIGFGIYKKNKR